MAVKISMATRTGLEYDHREDRHIRQLLFKVASLPARPSPRSLSAAGCGIGAIHDVGPDEGGAASRSCPHHRQTTAASWISSRQNGQVFSGGPLSARSIVGPGGRRGLTYLASPAARLHD